MISKRVKKVIEEFFPPVISRKIKNLSFCSNFKGSYLNWEVAKKLSSGYDSDIILDKVKESMLKVKNGKAAFARDSVLFDSIQYSFPVLAGLLRASISRNGELNVLDFGGSLGTSYYQCRKFLEGINKLKWNIIEQPKFVSCGRKLFENEELKFYNSIEECFQNEKPQTIILSSVIQYIEKPFLLLEEIMKYNFEYVIFDRTAFLRHGPDRLAIQKVPKRIHGGSFPIWFFNYDNFLSKLASRYDLVAEFDTVDKAVEPLFYKGFILMRKCKI